MEEKKIAIIGCGNLGMSILNGLLAHPSIKPANLIATRRNLEDLAALESSGVQLTTDNAKAVALADLVIVALKPYKILEVLASIKAAFDPTKHVLVSVATGVSLNDLQETVGLGLPIFRAMPNTATDVSTSITCISSNTDDQAAQALVTDCFNTVGMSLMIDEHLMDSATVLGACGIAYALRFIRGMIQGGIQIGFDAKTATSIATQTVKGAAELLIERKAHPEYEIDKVTTPKGCTIAGLNEMEHNGFSSALIKGIVTSFEEIEK